MKKDIISIEIIIDEQNFSRFSEISNIIECYNKPNIDIYLETLNYILDNINMNEKSFNNQFKSYKTNLIIIDEEALSVKSNYLKLFKSFKKRKRKYDIIILSEDLLQFNNDLKNYFDTK